MNGPKNERGNEPKNDSKNGPKNDSKSVSLGQAAASDPILDSLLKGMPEATHEPGGVQAYRVRMSDGAHLATRLYVPAGTGPWPAVLIRYPYPGMRPYLEATANVWTRYGYAVVLQDCRGTGESEGEWIPFENERRDGLDTIGWMLEQPWTNRRIGTYGPSYLSAVQWAMADALPSEVKAMALAGFTTERYRQLYMNGMFRHDVYTGWAIDNAGVPGVPAEGLFAKAIRTVPHIAMDEMLFGRKLPWYREWIANVSAEDEYWREGFWAELRDIPARVRTPVLMVDGWFDQHLDGMTRDYRKLPPATRAASRFILGPWVHSMQASGDYPMPGAERNHLKDALEWFDHHLKGREYPHPTGGVEAYAIGEGRWKRWDGWPEPDGFRTFYLSGGRLSGEPSFAEEAARFRYDPDRPVPTRGGAGLLRYLSGADDAAPAGSVLQPPPGEREDVLTFESEPLAEDLPIAGSIRVHLFASSDAEDTAFAANVMEVLPDGRAFNIRDGIVSLAYRGGATRPQPYEPGGVAEADIELWPIVWTIKAGSRLRVDVSSSNFPAYHAHRNVSGPWALQTEKRIANQTIYGGKDRPSRIVVPYKKD